MYKTANSNYTKLHTLPVKCLGMGFHLNTHSPHRRCFSEEPWPGPHCWPLHSAFHSYEFIKASFLGGWLRFLYTQVTLLRLNSLKISQNENNNTVSLPHAFITATCELSFIQIVSFRVLVIKNDTLWCKAPWNIIRYFMQFSKKVRVAKAKNMQMKIST